MKWLRITFAFVLLLGFFALIPFYVKSKDELEKRVSCGTEFNRPLILFVIDASDPYDTVDADRVTKEIGEKLLSRPEPLRFVMLGPNELLAYEPVVAIHGCIQPDLPESSAYLMSATDRESYIRERTATASAAKDGVDKLLRAGPLRSSPLLETIIAVSKRHDVRSATTKTLVLYSDMEQNSPALSVYGSALTTRPLEPIGLESISLQGMRIEVRRIVRRTRLGLQDQARLQSFWNNWFAGTGTTVEWSK